MDDILQVGPCLVLARPLWKKKQHGGLLTNILSQLNRTIKYFSVHISGYKWEKLWQKLGLVCLVSRPPPDPKETDPEACATYQHAQDNFSLPGFTKPIKSNQDKRTHEAGYRLFCSMWQITNMDKSNGSRAQISTKFTINPNPLKVCFYCVIILLCWNVLYG